MIFEKILETKDVCRYLEKHQLLKQYLFIFLEKNMQNTVLEREGLSLTDVERSFIDKELVKSEMSKGISFSEAYTSGWKKNEI